MDAILLTFPIRTIKNVEIGLKITGRHYFNLRDWQGHSDGGSPKTV